jgi:hypothetical protein
MECNVIQNGELYKTEFVLTLGQLRALRMALELYAYQENLAEDVSNSLKRAMADSRVR